MDLKSGGQLGLWYNGIVTLGNSAPALPTRDGFVRDPVVPQNELGREPVVLQPPSQTELMMTGTIVSLAAQSGAIQQQPGGPAQQQLGGWAQQQLGGPAQQQLGGWAQQQLGGPAQQQLGGPAQQQFGGLAQQQFGGPAQQQFGGPAQQQFGGLAQQQFGGPAQQQFGALAQQQFGGLAQQQFRGLAQQQFGGLAQQQFGGPAQQQFGGPAQQKPTKAFETGPSLPTADKGQQVFLGVNLRTNVLKDSPVDEAATQSSLNTTQLLGPFKEGKVSKTTVAVVDDMMKKLPKLSGCVPQGCITEQDIVPVDGKYQKDEHYKVLGLLGKGTFGHVALCMDNSSKKTFALKQIPRDRFHPNEVRVPIQFDHENMMKGYGILLQQCTVQVLQEYAGMSLRQYRAHIGDLFITRPDKPSARIWDLTLQGLAGLAYLHLHGIIHLDIKPENLCVLEAGGRVSLKIADYGTTKLPYERLTFRGMTAAYMAPELCQLYLQRKCGLKTDADVCGKVDVWAFALVIMFLYKGHHIMEKLVEKPCDQLTRSKTQEIIISTLANEPDLMKMLMCDEVDLDMRDLLMDMTHFDPKDRKCSKEALHRVQQKILTLQPQQHQLQLKLPVQPRPPARPWPPEQSQQFVQAQGTYGLPANYVQAQGTYGLPANHVQAQCTYGLPARMYPVQTQHLPAINQHMSDSRQIQAKKTTLCKLRQKLRPSPYSGEAATKSTQSKSQLTRTTHTVGHSDALTKSCMMQPIRPDDAVGVADQMDRRSGSAINTGLEQPMRPDDAGGTACGTIEPMEDYEIVDRIPTPDPNMPWGWRQTGKREAGLDTVGGVE